MREESELFHRHPGNPVLSAADFPYPMNSVFNPGAALLNGETVLLARVEDRRGISHLAVARSENGRTGWRVEPKPLIADDPADPTTRIGMGPPPIETPHGWLCFYHGVKQMVATSIYRVGIMLLDLEDPTKVLRRTPSWVLGPDASYERIGDVPNVVFPTGLTHDEEADDLRLYYGAADSTIAVATAKYSEVMDYLLNLPEEV
jgi:predicted GH43/DUF377 family glycosyl hydrolase